MNNNDYTDLVNAINEANSDTNGETISHLIVMFAMVLEPEAWKMFNDSVWDVNNSIRRMAIALHPSTQQGVSDA